MMINFSHITKMEEIQSHTFLLFALASLILLWSITKILSKPNPSKNPPPSPPKLPIIGNLHQLSSQPHRKLRSIAAKYGPLVLLHFGSLPVLIVSSADAAREILKTHDLTFSDRPQYEVVKKIVYGCRDGCRDVAFAAYGDYWRKLRGVFVTKLLSSKKVQSLRYIREEETALFVKKIGEYSSKPVNLSNMFAEFANDGICRSAFGRKFTECEKGRKFLHLVKEISQVLASGIGEFIPWLRWIDGVRGLDAKVEKVAKGLDEFLESVIEERFEGRDDQRKEFEGGGDGDNFVDILLENYDNKYLYDEVSIDKECIKAMILDIFLAGTETISTTLEWTMAELLRHPIAMQKLQREVREIVKDKQNVTDDDLAKMRYLKAVIKEALRHHPPLPLLLPRVARADVSVNGYDISKGTVVMINAWAIGRDPVAWDEPEKFKPERFLESSIDFMGLDFELIPFGSGRRGCPGVTYSMVNIELLVANIVQKFNWELPNAGEGKDFDMSESYGLSVYRAIPLIAVATVAP